MEYKVILHSESQPGLIYSAIWPTTKTKNLAHVVLTCREVDVTNPVYLFARTVPIPPATSGQSIHLPHASVVMVVEYDKAEKQPPGFL